MLEVPEPDQEVILKAHPHIEDHALVSWVHALRDFTIGFGYKEHSHLLLFDGLIHTLPIFEYLYVWSTYHASLPLPLALTADLRWRPLKWLLLILLIVDVLCGLFGPLCHVWDAVNNQPLQY